MGVITPFKASLHMQSCNMNKCYHTASVLDKGIHHVRKFVQVCHVAERTAATSVSRCYFSDRSRHTCAPACCENYFTAARDVGQHAQLSIRSSFESRATKSSSADDPWLRRTPVTYLQFRNSILEAEVGAEPEPSDRSQRAASPTQGLLELEEDATRAHPDASTSLKSLSPSASSPETSTSQSPDPGPHHDPGNKSEDGALDTGPKTTRNRYFPYSGLFPLAGSDSPLTSEEVIELLDPFLVDGRRTRMEKVVRERTYGVVPVVEGLVDLGNVSAICRTAEALGFQSVQVISTDHKRRFKDNRKISMGTDKWLDLELWEESGECFKALRERGYRIAVTHIAEDTIPIYDMDWTIPTAIVFGNEHKGISRAAIAQSDLRCSIPMGGMVDSFNVSVAAGITLHHIMRDRMERQGFHGDLRDEERRNLLAAFMLRHKAHTSSVIERLLSQRQVSYGQRTGNAYEIFLERQGQREAAEERAMVVDAS